MPRYQYTKYIYTTRTVRPNFNRENGRKKGNIDTPYIYMTAHPAGFVKDMPTKRGGVKLALMGQMSSLSSGKCLPHVSKM